MAEWICEYEYCKRNFTRPRSGQRKIRFCSQSCYHKWRKDEGITTGQFQDGSEPWNKGVKGIHLSPETEFKKGGESYNELPIGSVTIRERKREKHPRAFIKIAEPSVWKMRCHIVWEKHYGAIPKGLVIHHIDRDTLNDEVSNLAAVSRAWHMKDHKPEIEPKRLEGIKNAVFRRKNTT